MTSSQPFISQEHELKCELAAEVLRSSGRLRIQVTGWSMLPAIWPGDILVLESASPAEITEGDIVLFRRDRRLFAHRVVRRGEDQVQTRGDAMKYADAPIGKDELLGRLNHIVRNGKRIEPDKKRGVSQRAIAGLVRTSETATRVLVGIHAMAAQF
jgi:signal peptidase I